MSYRDLIDSRGIVRPAYLMQLAHKCTQANVARYKGFYAIELREQLVRIWRTARDLEQEYKWLNGRSNEVPMSIVNCIGGANQSGVRRSVWG